MTVQANCVILPFALREQTLKEFDERGGLTKLAGGAIMMSAEVELLRRTNSNPVSASRTELCVPPPAEFVGGSYPPRRLDRRPDLW